jgi:hypothetical protein
MEGDQLMSKKKLTLLSLLAVLAMSVAVPVALALKYNPSGNPAGNIRGELSDLTLRQNIFHTFDRGVDFQLTGFLAGRASRLVCPTGGTGTGRFETATEGTEMVGTIVGGEFKVPGTCRVFEGETVTTCTVTPAPLEFKFTASGLGRFFETNFKGETGPGENFGTITLGGQTCAQAGTYTLKGIVKCRLDMNRALQALPFHQFNCDSPNELAKMEKTTGTVTIVPVMVVLHWDVKLVSGGRWKVEP